jgi:hypothetical protein
VELLAFEAGCEDYCEREVGEVEWQVAACTSISVPAVTTHRSANRSSALKSLRSEVGTRCQTPPDSVADG